MTRDCSIDGFCELLHEVSRLCARKQAEALAMGGFAVAEFSLMAAIVDEPRPRLEDLAARLDVSRGRLTRILDGLERKRLVIRRRDPADQRSVVLEITTHGRRALEDASRLRAEAGGALLASMDDSQQTRLIESLRLLRARMTGDEDDEDRAAEQAGGAVTVK